jgi:hypothetical protein
LYAVPPLMDIDVAIAIAIAITLRSSLYAR